MVKVDLDDNKSLYVSIYPVTFKEYDLFCSDTNRCEAISRWGRGNQPVINVSWSDAIKYSEWLSENSDDKQYVLPTSKDWLLVAKKNISNINLMSSDTWFNKKKGTSNVTIGGIGQLGISHMYGNVYEWCSDEIKFDKGIVLGGSYRTTNIKKFLSEEVKHSLKCHTIGFRMVCII